MTLTSLQLEINQIQTRISYDCLDPAPKSGTMRDTITLKEKLKRKMQVQLSRQLRADKKAEAERIERESRRQARRDEEMRELAIKLRRKQREMRHLQNRQSSEEGSDKSRSGSSSRTSPDREKAKEKSRSKSRSPEAKRIAVWEPHRETQLRTRSIQDCGETSSQERRKYPEHSDASNNQSERLQNYQRHDKQREHSRNYGSQYQYDDRTNYGYGRRPFSHRGVQRPISGHGSGYGPIDEHGDGPSKWPRTEPNEKEGSSSKSKVKLVDY